jgi:hypothetical protein
LPPYFHTLSWLIGDGDKTRKDRPFQTRDGKAEKQLCAAMQRLGYDIGTDLLNYPPQDGQAQSELAHVDTSFSRPKDVLGTYTRIPASDLVQKTRKKIPLGFTDIEDEVMHEWHPYVPHASRLIVQLHPRLHHLLPEKREDRARIKVYERACAPLNELTPSDGPMRKYSGEELRTPVFLLRVPKMQKRNMEYLGIWGVDGDATLIWACLLRHDRTGLLDRHHFVMAELIGGSVPERTFDLRYALDWRFEILIDEPIRRPARSGGSRSRARRSA